MHAVLNRLAETRGLAQSITVDHGPEFEGLGARHVSVRYEGTAIVHSTMEAMAGHSALMPVAARPRYIASTKGGASSRWKRCSTEKAAALKPDQANADENAKGRWRSPSFLRGLHGSLTPSRNKAAPEQSV